MRKYLRYFTFISIFAITATSCKKDDAVQNITEPKLIQSDIAGVNGPLSGKINQELIFSLMWQSQDAPLKFDHIDDSTFHNLTTIRLFALTNVADTASVKDINTVAYKFKAATAGTYYLKFYKVDNDDRTAIIDTLIIK